VTNALFTTEPEVITPLVYVSSMPTACITVLPWEASVSPAAIVPLPPSNTRSPAFPPANAYPMAAAWH